MLNFSGKGDSCQRFARLRDFRLAARSRSIVLRQFRYVLDKLCAIVALYDNRCRGFSKDASFGVHKETYLSRRTIFQMMYYNCR